MRIGRRRSARHANVREDYPVLGPVVCAGALVWAVPRFLPGSRLSAPWFCAEAFRLHHWRFRRNEGKVECQALANFMEPRSD